MKLTPLTSRLAPERSVIPATVERESLLLDTRRGGLLIGVDYPSVVPVPGYEPSTGTGLANVPFYDPDPLESAPRAI